MGWQTTRLAAIGVLMAGSVAGQAQELVSGGGAVPVTHGSNRPCRRGYSCRRLWEWMTYRPLPVPKSCKCRKWQATATPPLYLYFIGEFGPRSPDLGFAGPHHGYAVIGQDHEGPIHHHVVPLQDVSPAKEQASPEKAAPVPIHPAGAAVPVHDAPADAFSAISANLRSANFRP